VHSNKAIMMKIIIALLFAQEVYKCFYLSMQFIEAVEFLGKYFEQPL
jgi:hypothetical protein